MHIHTYIQTYMHTIHPGTIKHLQSNCNQTQMHATINLKFLQTFGPIGQIYDYHVFYLEASPCAQNILTKQFYIMHIFHIYISLFTFSQVT